MAMVTVSADVEERPSVKRKRRHHDNERDAAVH
jgi:hypothetical protein